VFWWCFLYPLSLSYPNCGAIRRRKKDIPNPSELTVGDGRREREREREEGRENNPKGSESDGCVHLWAAEPAPLWCLSPKAVRSIVEIHSLFFFLFTFLLFYFLALNFLFG
jgi:hypothetical protein